ncbi:MAG TPA: BON domain-containing protein [Burkholderiales bacterium]|nr:BON domain-containing protein [Burkholderiales bacterium]
MNFSAKKRRHQGALWYAVAGVLVLGLAGCGEKPPAETGAGKNTDRAAEKAGQETNQNQVAGTAEQKFEQAKETISEKAAATGQAIEDTALTAKVKAALIAEPGLNALAIDITTKGGVVSLFGTADTAANRDKAVQVASKVEGVKSVVDKLVIAKGS